MAQVYISVIIPNFNGERLLRQNLPALVKELRESELKFELIISDDCSTDGSVNYLEAYQQDEKDVSMQIIKSTKNNGFSVAVEKAVNLAQGEILLLLNTDVKPEGGFLQPLLSHFEDKQVFAVGCMDKSVENERIVLRGRGVGRWERGFLLHSAGKLDKTNTLWVSGGSSAFRRDVWKKLE